MTAPDHAMKPLENILRERGHPYMVIAMASPRRRPTSRRLRHNNQPLYRRSSDEMGLHVRVYIIGDARRIRHAF
jgi:hypothetical protein